MKIACTLLLLTVVACTNKERSADTLLKASTDSPEVAVAPVLPPLDTLVVALDSARGFYWPKTGRQLVLTNANLRPEQFRAYGREGVQRLIDCMSDTVTTATYHADDTAFKYPRGVLCYEVLRQLVDFDASRQLSINSQDLYVSMEQRHVRRELAQAKRAWQVMHNAKAYRLRSLPVYASP